jgi:hypothetical protein
LFVYVVLIELVTSVQSAQSNGLVAALFLLTFAMLERRQVALASLFTALNVAIKVFGGAGLLLFVMYPRKARSAAWTVAWLALLAALPLVLVGPSELAAIYRAWFALLRQDTVRANTVSFYGWLDAWFRVSPPREIVLGASVAAAQPATPATPATPSTGATPATPATPADPSTGTAAIPATPATPAEPAVQATTDDPLAPTTTTDVKTNKGKKKSKPR